jgi:hypothetical protein
MIEINLLPEDLKKKRKQFAMPKIQLGSLPVIGGIAGLVIVVHLLLLLIVSINKSAYARMSEEWKAAKPEKEAIELIKRDNIRTKKDVDTIKRLMGKKALWSKKLNQLSDLIIPGVWYTKLSIETKTIVLEKKTLTAKPRMGMAGRPERETREIVYLNIEGEVSSAYGEEVAIIGKYIDNLKSDPDFFGFFSDIELAETNLHSILETEVMQFGINCYFKEGMIGDGAG